MKLPLTGQQYSEKVTENCVAIWKSLGIYTDSEAKAVERFLEVFKDETFPPGASILFALASKGSLTVLDAFITFYSVDLRLRFTFTCYNMKLMFPNRTIGFDHKCKCQWKMKCSMPCFIKDSIKLPRFSIKNQWIR